MKLKEILEAIEEQKKQETELAGIYALDRLADRFLRNYLGVKQS